MKFVLKRFSQWSTALAICSLFIFSYLEFQSQIHNVFIGCDNLEMILDAKEEISESDSFQDLFHLINSIWCSSVIEMGGSTYYRNTFALSKSVEYFSCPRFIWFRQIRVFS